MERSSLVRNDSERGELTIEEDKPASGSLNIGKYTKALALFGSLTAVLVIAILITTITKDIKDKHELPSDPYERALKLMEMSPLLDSHNDLPWQYRARVQNNILQMPIQDNLTDSANFTGLQTDIPRLRAGKVGAQIWSVYINCGAYAPVQEVAEQMDDVYRMTIAYPDDFQLVLSSDDIMTAFKAGRIASLMGMEGGHSINSSMGALRSLYNLGARYMTLTHSCSTPWAQSSNDNSGDVIGLTAYGKMIVQEMNRIGMMVDISHVAVQTMYDALNTSTAPVIFSHSNALALCNNSRNVPDDVLERMPQNGGVVMVVFYPLYVCQRFGVRLAELNRACNGSISCVEAGMTAYQQSPDACNVTDVALQIDYIRQKAGIDYVGIGSDFDGVEVLPVGLEDVSKYPNLIAKLIEMGYSDEDVQKVLSGNMIRVLKAVEDEAKRLQQTNPVGTAPAIGPLS